MKTEKHFGSAIEIHKRFRDRNQTVIRMIPRRTEEEGEFYLVMFVAA